MIKQKINIINVFVFLFGIFSFVSIYAGLSFSWTNDDAWRVWNDKWTLDWVLSVEETYTDNYSDNNIRGYLNPWSLTSELFWDWTYNELTLTDWGNLGCIDSDGSSIVTYDISGSFNSFYYWDMIILPWSYYCPTTYELDVNIYSDSLWTKNINNYLYSTSWYENIGFDKQEVYINWISNVVWNSTDLDSLSNTDKYSEESWIESLHLDSSIKANLNNTINKNLYTSVRSLEPENSKDSSNLSDWVDLYDWNYYIDELASSSPAEKYYYFNYSWEEADDNLYWNKWKNLTIENVSSFDETNPENYSLWVTWENIIFVDGWNIYINSDIYNNDDSTDLLVIVAKRDEENELNWWNIYIDPDVTNIDAILIADWSILNYDWISVVEWKAANKQLLIYGSVMTSNTIWTNEVPYGSDLYFTDEDDTSGLYNFSNLREFNLTYSDSIESTWTCYSPSWYLTPRIWGLWLEYAWAWKYECYNPDIDSSSWDTKVANLRTTELMNPVVILYNTNIYSINPNILN